MARPKPNLTPKQLKERSVMWVRKWRENNPERQALIRKRAYLNRKIKAFKLIGEVKCNKCGCNEVDYLEFNHKNGGGAKEFRKEKYKAMMDQILTNKRKINDLEILCRVCNALEFLERKNNKHIGRYKIIWE